LYQVAIKFNSVMGLIEDVIMVVVAGEFPSATLVESSIIAL